MALTDDGLSLVSALPSLTELSVQGCPHLTDAGLASLVKLPNLRWLHVGACDGITQAGRDALQRALPRLKVDR
jgi:hypothetical protein